MVSKPFYHWTNRDAICRCVVVSRSCALPPLLQGLDESYINHMIYIYPNRMASLSQRKSWHFPRFLSQE